jgi:hypothetical protein
MGEDRLGGYVAARSHSVAVIQSAAERNSGFQETGHLLSTQRERERERGFSVAGDPECGRCRRVIAMR